MLGAFEKPTRGRFSPQKHKARPSQGVGGEAFGKDLGGRGFVGVGLGFSRTPFGGKRSRWACLGGVRQAFCEQGGAAQGDFNAVIII